MTGLFKPKIEKGAAPPEPPSIEAPKRELGGSNFAKPQIRKRKGRSALRIDVQTGGVKSKGTGVNVPVK